jgi:hypothetical protein
MISRRRWSFELKSTWIALALESHEKERGEDEERVMRA